MTRDENAYILQPNLPLSTQPLVNEFYKRLGECPDSDCVGSAIATSLASINLGLLPEVEALTLRLFFEVLQDVTNQGWRLVRQDDKLFAFSPDTKQHTHEQSDDVKKRLRNSLISARNEQLQQESVRKFIVKMERPRDHKGRSVSVLSLFLDHKELIKDIEEMLAEPDLIRDELLLNSIQPYLQLADDTRDEFTGLKLSQIWRYCRYTWSLPYSAQPGRQMQYLVRDAARENHPIIGLGGLGNSVVQITCRDETIGWSIEYVSRSPEKYIPTFLKELNRGIDDIYWSDLLTRHQVEDPTVDTLASLLHQAHSIPSVNSTSEIRTSSSRRDGVHSPLYRRKRALALHELLRAKRTFMVGMDETTTHEDLMNWLLQREEGRRAVATAIRSIKKRHIGTSMMDLTTCGAIPPYNDILGGKLVSLLMASPQIVADYRAKYTGAVSEIASKMKGISVSRRAELAMIGTTSLYYVGSSQYNRLRLSMGRGSLSYLYVGKTRGYGSVHLSQRTYKTLQRLLDTHKELNRASSTFAAGVNFKMRTIAEGLRYIGLIKLMQHETPRRVYLVPLASNWREYLTGIDETLESIYSLEDPCQETAEIIIGWKRRWFLQRVTSGVALSRLRQRTRNVRLSDFLVHS